MTGRQYRLMYAGLLAAIVGNILATVWAIGDGLTPAGNVTAIVFCAGAIWLIRQRQRGRI